MKQVKTQKRRTVFIISVFLIVLLIIFSLGHNKRSETSIETQIYNLKDGDTFNLEAISIIKKIGDISYYMYGYNGQIPGPTFRVQQNSKVYINFTNNIDMGTTIHWHGLRHDNKFDGVPNVTQDPVNPGKSFLYELKFPDAGIFWYHPHIREDIQQEKGLYGNIIVEPVEKNKQTIADKEITLVLDDILTDKKDFYPFSNQFTNFALMGRFGNVLFINGDTNYELKVKKGEIVKFYLTNVANVRPFNFSIGNIKLKVVGSDLSNYETSFWSDSIVIAPAERYIIEAQFKEKGVFNILNVNPLKTYKIGKIIVEENAVTKKSLSLDNNTDVQKDIAQFQKFFYKDPDYIFTLSIDMQGMQMGHMEINDDLIEWEDTMFDMNSMHNNKMMKWIIKDKETDKENMDIIKDVNVNTVKIIRLINKKDSEHPMQHPIHLHGQRFLVLRENGKINNNLVWKDTVLVPKGSTTDILVEFTNPGKWMMHCHIAEHLESGMMMMFDIRDKKDKESEPMR